MDISLTVLISTFNRADSIRETLEAMCHVRRDGLLVEFVVIDNNSSDNTKEIIESFISKLPLRYMFQPRPGKSCALNKALNEVKLGEIVVFTDDDVTPEPDWLRQIADSCLRNHKYSAGGGKIIGIWPDGQLPEWIPFARGAFKTMDINLGDDEIIFPYGQFPSGPNFWISRKLFDEGLRFDESFGPVPKKMVMGEDLLLALSVMSRGHEIIYCPYSVVYHRLQKSLAAAKGIRRRAYTFGRGQARVWGFARPGLHNRHRRIWQLRCLAALGYSFARIIGSCISLTKGRRTGRSLEPIADMAFHIESLKMDSCGEQGIFCQQKDFSHFDLGESTLAEKMPS